AAQQGDELAIRLIENAGFWCGHVACCAAIGVICANTQ
ncbi:MAG: hypothetical protein RLZZ184_1874, partial [Cyanobacteriota bacterium]